MVGGKVIETIDTGEKVWINCRETQNGSRTEAGIYVERTDAARSISVGDSVWWNGFSAYWTPSTRAFQDYKLVKIGMAGMKRPELANVGE